MNVYGFHDPFQKANCYFRTLREAIKKAVRVVEVQVILHRRRMRVKGEGELIPGDWASEEIVEVARYSVVGPRQVKSRQKLLVMALNEDCFTATTLVARVGFEHEKGVRVKRLYLGRSSLLSSRVFDRNADHPAETPELSVAPTQPEDPLAEGRN